MAEEIKELIAKIQREGIQVAEKKAGEIENQARLKAEEIISRAKSEANKILQKAKEQSAELKDSTLVNLQQSGRDFLLSLKKEINALLEKVIIQDMRKSLVAGEMVKLIIAAVNKHSQKSDDEITLSLSSADVEILKKGFLAELAEETKKKITLRPADDISAGFIISYDKGKSHFDFSDKALCEYIIVYLRPELNKILKTD